jgi:hypothetical protein
LADTVFKEADPAFGNVNFGTYLTKYGPEVGLAAYLEEITDTPDGVSDYIGRTDFLNQYIQGMLS